MREEISWEVNMEGIRNSFKLVESEYGRDNEEWVHIPGLKFKKIWNLLPYAHKEPNSISTSSLYYGSSIPSAFCQPNHLK